MAKKKQLLGAKPRNLSGAKSSGYRVYWSRRGLPARSAWVKRVAKDYREAMEAEYPNCDAKTARVLELCEAARVVQVLLLSELEGQDSLTFEDPVTGDLKVRSVVESLNKFMRTEKEMLRGLPEPQREEINVTPAQQITARLSRGDDQ